MSENIPSTSASSPSPHHPKKTKRRYDKTKLPTPPPDPTETPTDDREEFLAYLDSLHKSSGMAYSRSTSTFAPVIATEDAFDHLEKLYKLMEQMLELREQNAKLHRRVRDLEHFNNLEKMHKQIDITSVQRDCPELDKDTAFAETILESILSEAKSPKQKSSASSRLRQSISRRPRNRSGSVSDKTLEIEQIKPDRRASTCVDNRTVCKPAKVSKWTKVKAAFKWEKASPTVSDAKSQDSGIGGMVPVNLEVARYLRVPSTSEDVGHSPADSGAAEISTPGTLSTASSTEDFHRNDLRSPCEDLRSSDDEHSHNYIPHSKEGSQKSNKSHKTPWAKMKDMIQTRNSFKKKHRLSAHSDDIQIDIELCSDNEDVFEDEDKNKSPPPQSPSPGLCPKIYRRVDSSELPPELIARYQRIVAEDGSISENTDSKKISKWTRVKKAFLTQAEPVQDASSHRESSKLDEDTKNIQAEIQRNYKQLQKKLSLEFQEKLSEWERMKQNSPGTSNPSSSCGFVDDPRDQAFIKKMEEWQKLKSQPSIRQYPKIQLTSEEHLPPEFRKKLQEWERMRKQSNKEAAPKKKLGEVPRWKSLSGHRSEHSSSFEYPPLSEDFRKKLQEWKQIKSGSSVTSGDDIEKKTKDISKPSSPRLYRKNSSPKHSKKQKDPHDKELQWFEKELGKIEKEKQRLERERQKFLEREERLSKLRNSVVGGHKKEILIHTPSGFHRFEGISRKFTQKLYEWEKAQGIGPESSTFALLSSSLIQDSSSCSKLKDNLPAMVRSKSADSIAISALNLTCPLMSHQPSSLSLNDVENLEKECLADSKSSSMQFMSHSRETLGQDEPEALIVEVEDIIEETAAPLRTYSQKIQQPVYQRQELKAMCEGETCVAPKVRRSESARAQNNYNIIEEVFNLLKNLAENELEIQRTQDAIVDTVQNKRHNADILKLQTYDESQKAISSHLSDKMAKLQEANSTVVFNLTKDDPSCNVGHVIEVLETVQDLSTEIFHLTEKLETEINHRNVYNTIREAGARSLTPILETIKDIRSKVLELRRRLSYVCAASDLTAPRRKQSLKKRPIKKTTSNESKESSDTSRPGSQKVPRLYIKSETSNTQSQGAIKKRIRYRQKSLQNRSLPDTDDEEEILDQKRNIHKKLTRTRSISESSVNREQAREEAVVVDESIIQKVVVPTKTNFVTVTNDNLSENTPNSPLTLFVKTTRKLFTPLVESGLGDNSQVETQETFVKVDSPKISVNVAPSAEEIKQEEKIISEQSSDTTSEKTVSGSSIALISHLPPLPASPTVQRKVTKDISPSIRLMLAKYNQKLSEQDALPSCKSGGSSGSASPVAWRSPSSERRVRAQMERYQEGLNKLSPLLTERRAVQKSASVGVLHSSHHQIVVPRRDSIQNAIAGQNCDSRNILKSSSSSVLVVRRMKGESKIDENRGRKNSLHVVIDDKLTESKRHSPEIRLKKLQKAKEEFLNSSPPSAPVSSETIKFPTRNRLSQISVGSESSYDSSCAGALIKSASAGMINIDPDAYKQFDPEIHVSGYVSLPRSTKKAKESLLSAKSAFSSIASKFRKVKMRRGKDKDHSKMNAVSTLCRQSLVVDINKSLSERQGNETASESREMSSEDVSSSSSKTGSWIRKAKLFKK